MGVEELERQVAIVEPPGFVQLLPDQKKRRALFSF